MHTKLFTPGPTHVRPEILAEMARLPISHRGKDLQALMAEILPGLRRVFGVRGELAYKVVLTTSSSTGMMEAALVSTVPRGGRVLNLICGGFGERWHDITRAHSREGVPLRVDWGRALKPECIELALQQGHYDAVTLVHNETSTGILNPLREIAAVVRRFNDVLLLVDSVSSLGGTPVEVEQNDIDICLAGSQKCLALPPGLAVGAISSRALERAKHNPDRGFYLDLITYVAFAENGEAPFTSTSSHLFALRRQLQDMEKESDEARYARHRAMAKHVHVWAESRFSLFAEEGYRSPTVTVVEVPQRFNLPGLFAGLEREGFRIAAGYGRLKERTFRIGHMGDLTVADVRELMDVIDTLLERL